MKSPFTALVTLYMGIVVIYYSVLITKIHEVRLRALIRHSRQSREWVSQDSSVHTKYSIHVEPSFSLLIQHSLPPPLPTITSFSQRSANTVASRLTVHLQNTESTRAIASQSKAHVDGSGPNVSSWYSVYVLLLFPEHSSCCWRLRLWSEC